MKKIICVLVCLVVSICSWTTTFASESEEKTDVKNDIDCSLDNISNKDSREIVEDLLKVEYLEVKTVNNSSLKLSKQATEDLEAEDVTPELVNELIKKEPSQVKREMKTILNDIISLAEDNPNIMILPSSYEVFEKYGYNLDKSILESHELTVTDKDLKTIKGSKGYKGWDKTATGYIKNGAGSKVAKYNINVQWFINSNGQIYYWDTNQTHSNNSNYYVFIKNAITSAKVIDNKARLKISGYCKFKKKKPVPTGIPKYNKIIINITCSKHGDFSSTFKTEASYN